MQHEAVENKNELKFDALAWGLAAFAFVLHAAFANRYDVFRDELYFIVCGRHPDFGYADQPPLVPLLSAALYAFGHQTWLLRLPCVLAAAVLPWLAVKFVRLAGGGNGAAIAAGIACTIAPMLMGLMAVFNTTVFEPIAWTGIAYFLARAITRGEQRALIWCGAIAGLALEAKYSGVLWLGSLALGLLATPQRGLFIKPSLWIGAALAAAIAAPSTIWQAAHGWPFIELMQAAQFKNTQFPPSEFLLNQVKVMNPLLAPLWLAGIVAPFLIFSLKPLRFLSIAFALALTLTIISHGKDYYIAAAFPSMFVLGATAFEHYVRAAWARAVYLVLAIALSTVAAPLALPILPPAMLLNYMKALHQQPQQEERSFAGTPLPQVFADQFGWRDFTKEVGVAWREIPPELRATTSIKVDNYGEAAALDIYGGPYQLPPALTGHNQYFLWGLRGQHPINALVVQGDVNALRPYCTDVQVFGRTYSPYAMADENGKVIALCRNVHPSIEELWPRLKNFS